MSTPTHVKLLAGMFAASGTVHLVKPEVYEPIMPPWVPQHREVILGSGIAEIVLAAGLLSPRTRRLAAWGSVGLLLGVYPANIQMSLDAAKADNKPMLAVSLARLPLQWPMVKTALRVARGG
ncbi:MAG: DoxX family protein [Nocardioides sp.]